VLGTYPFTDGEPNEFGLEPYVAFFRVKEQSDFRVGNLPSSWSCKLLCEANYYRPT